MNTPAPLDLPLFDRPNRPTLDEESSCGDADGHTDEGHAEAEQPALCISLLDANDALTPTTWELEHDLAFQTWQQFSECRFESAKSSSRSSKSRSQADLVSATKANLDGTSDWANHVPTTSTSNSIDGTQQGKFDLYASMMDEVNQAFGIAENTNASTGTEETHQDDEIELPRLNISLDHNHEDQLHADAPEGSDSIFSMAAAADRLEDEPEPSEHGLSAVNVLPCVPVVFHTPDGQLRFDDSTGMMDLGHASSYQHDSWCLTGQMTLHDATQVYHFQLATGSTVKPVLLLSVRTDDPERVTPAIALSPCDGEPLQVDILHQQAGTQMLQVRGLEPNTMYWLTVSSTNFESRKPATVWVAFDFREHAVQYQNLATGVLWETQELSAHNLAVTQPCFFGFDLSAISPTSQNSTISLGILDSVGNVVFSQCTSPGQTARGSVLLDTGCYIVRLTATPAAVTATLDHLAINLQYQSLPNPCAATPGNAFATLGSTFANTPSPGYTLTPLLATDPLTWCEHVLHS